MAKILFFDTECNSLDTERGFIQELGWAVYDVDTKRLLRSQSSILSWNMQYEVDPGALAVTQLTRAYCEEHGRPVKNVIVEFISDVNSVDAIAGHNLIDYDLKILKSNLLRSMFSSPDWSSKLIFDTMFDCPYPNPKQTMALKYLAYDHGYILSNAHQALADVFACAHVFFSYPYAQCLEIARTPLVTTYAQSNWQEKDFHEKLKRQKFRWNSSLKRWERRARAYYVPGTQLELGRDLFTDSPVEAQKLPSELPF